VVAMKISGITAVQIDRDPAGGSGDLLGFWTRTAPGGHEVAEFCCPD
jgi:hypothetical protein